jgi:PLP dependent protein
LDSTTSPKAVRRNYGKRPSQFPTPVGIWSVICRRTRLNSIDRWELAEEISKEEVKQKLNVRGLIEVKLTSEEAKHGFDADDLRRRWKELQSLPGLTIDGMMGMAALEADEDACRAAFRTLRMLRDELRPADDPLPILSMGMSDDFEIAIEEGATHIRVGSALFEGLMDAS